MSKTKFKPEVFSFSGPNPVWDSIIDLLKQQIEAESEFAVGEHKDDSQRAWACGRSAAIRDFLRLLEDIREQNRSDS